MTQLSGTILVVEDDHDIRDTLLESLEEEGFPVLGVEGCRQALELLRSAPDAPAVILLDLMMPGMSGAEFREAQLADPGLSAIPVVVISAASGAEERAARLQPAAYLKKPLKLKALLDVAERFASRR